MLDRNWQATCRTILGQEVGELREFAGWFEEINEPMVKYPSSLSGKDVCYVENRYCKGARRINLAEVDFQKKFEPLIINEIKDIDSLIGAVRERMAYAGNVTLGNSQFVQESSNISDSHFIYNSGRVDNSKYVAFSTDARFCDGLFGSLIMAYCEHVVRGHIVRASKRCLEIWLSNSCSDCVYGWGLENCSDCLFSFHLRSKRNCVGNLELEKGKYAAVKAAIMQQLSDELRAKKRLSSLIEIVGECNSAAPRIKISAGKGQTQALSKEPIEKAFSQTAKIVLGKPLVGIDAYSVWLTRGVRTLEKVPSAISGKDVILGHHPSFGAMPKDRLIGLDEAVDFGEQVKMGREVAESLSLEGIERAIAPIAFLTSEMTIGNSVNNVECPVIINAANCYRTPSSVETKYAAYSFWPRNSNYVFGCQMAFQSQFCIRCHNSANLERCFECDSCRNCSDCYFCHNCENVQNGIFCFNVKNKNYAVGNVEVGKEAYMAFRERFLAGIVSKIEKTQSLRWDIFNVGCLRKK